MITDIEINLISNYVKDMNKEQEVYLLSRLSSRSMLDELIRRSELDEAKLSSIGQIIQATNL